jgi:hypothetical protein
MKLKFCYVSGGEHPVIGQVLYPAQIISESSEGERYQRYLANALGSVAREMADCDRLLGLISSVENGEEEQVVYDGDDVELVMTKDEVQVNIHANSEWVGKPEGRIGASFWRAALEARKRFLVLPERLDSAVEVDIPV